MPVKITFYLSGLLNPLICTCSTKDFTLYPSPCAGPRDRSEFPQRLRQWPCVSLLFCAKPTNGHAESRQMAIREWNGIKEAIFMSETCSLPTVEEQGLNHDMSNEERLERGEVVYYPVCPFPLPEGDDRTFLLEQQLGGRVHKNIGFDPRTGKAGGFLRHNQIQAERLRHLLSEFSKTTNHCVARTLPQYSRGWQLDRVSFRPEEEATRRLRMTARNDLLHVDAFPSRPTNGHRILRLFVNINPVDPRIWVTSDPFGKLLDRYGAQAGLPTSEGAP